MNPTEIDKMEAGPELDALVAKKVMGWKLEPYTAYCGGTPEQARQEAIKQGWYYWEDENGDEIPGQLEDNSFSTDIAAAWKVVELLNKKFKTFVEFIGVNIPVMDWRVVLFSDSSPVVSLGRTAPLAICRAALKAVGVNQL
jgi:hypothetical protein